MYFIVLHWYYLYISKPNPVYHIVVSILLFAYQKFILKQSLNYKKNAQNTIGICLMYLGFYITHELAHFGFLPFYGISLVGLRKKMFAFYVFSIVTGFVLSFLPLQTVLSHVLMNVGRLIRIKKMSITSCILSSIVAAIAGRFQQPSVDFGYKEVLAVLSTFQLINKKERMDIFSLCMCYSYFWALLLPLLHSFCLDWYRCYENNHFYRVKRSYLYFTPIAIIFLRLLYASTKTL